MKPALPLLAIALFAAHASELPLINDNFAKARAEAAERHLPVFVDCWAPW